MGPASGTGGSGGTAREEVRAPSAGGLTAREPSGLTGFVRVGLVPSLASRFRVVRELPAGGEADVVVAADGEDRLWVVKQYRRPEWKPSADVLDALEDLRHGQDVLSWAASPVTRHLVWVALWGEDPATGLFWEVQEYLQEGALAGVSDGGDGRPRGVEWSRLGDWGPSVLVGALADAVSGFHSVVGAHRDVKPGNVLVRSVDPLVLVLADVGLARQVGDLSARLSQRAGSAAYQAPEAAQGLVARAGDWWAVGMMLAEAVLGRHPLALPDGSLPEAQQIQAWVAQRDVPLEGIADERLRLLCRGLLTRDSEQRWRAAQVRAWLAGETPAVAAAGPAVPVTGGPLGTAGRVRSVRFAGQDFDSPAGLAGALARDPQLAGRLLFTNRDAVLVEDLRLMLAAHQLFEAQAVLDRYRSGAWQPSLLRLLTEMDPQLEPRLAGQEMTPTGIAALAGQVIEGGAPTPAQTQAMTWIVEHDLWRIWRTLPGMTDAAAAAERLAVPGVLAAAGDVVVLGGDGPRIRPSLSRSESGEGPDQVLVDREAVAKLMADSRLLAIAWACLLAAVPAEGERELDQVLNDAAGSLHDVTWWIEPARDRSNPTRTGSRRIQAAATIPLAYATKIELPAGHQRRQAAQDRARAEVARRERQAAIEAESRRKQAESDELRRRQAQSAARLKKNLWTAVGFVLGAALGFIPAAIVGLVVAFLGPIFGLADNSNFPNFLIGILVICAGIFGALTMRESDA